MDIKELKNTVNHLMSGDKGLLAMDESTATCNKRFEALGILQTEEYRRKYRELIVTTPGLEAYISGAILFDETIRQTNIGGTLLGFKPIPLTQTLAAIVYTSVCFFIFNDLIKFFLFKILPLERTVKL
ncbi:MULTISPECIES: class I fructose-bisphosphate aldolase [unclassified Mucilaginibacter]|uniref:class I fructose-bisphosphate aldolase n=1 Tax=unclassified Mucilaginibacter TaxID=2617802 RepID=UPI002AC9C26A|nr:MULTISPECIES: class I fructose-bisphosphate aldolase [unclassified Mucilaginibacter]MEB0261144.1 fructose-bisphosphate aldolase [Mucilaginibacter sp. 10I4]MEB0280520.1 fructose-bisphosphate aldolase [Mucilaginibacter sp. 10B2]MEB0301274.1 fructose-bisphosphate aldolase [Mucilaginibacter sp. 5C4]WPX22494.1 class I fructose-bisphosphate aldolase [Mucilaginibacter sp. 5C4]